MNALDSFTPLEDLIQVVYQGLHRFVLLSKVDYDSPEPNWNIHLGLADDGRWWKGKWVEKDVHDFIGSNVSSELLHSFTENIANMMVSGDLFVGNWREEKGAEIKVCRKPARPSLFLESDLVRKVVFGPSEKRPLCVPMTEMSTEESAIFVANEFISIALNAQSRKCRLNPPPFAEIAITHLPSLPPSKTKRVSASPPPSNAPITAAASSSKPRAKPEVATSSRIHEPEAVTRKVEPTPAPKAKTSIAGPRKKARKIQQMEFGSDDE